MNAGDVAALVIAGATAISAIGMLVAISAAVKTLTAIRGTVDDVRREAVPLLGEMRVAVHRANTELTKVDSLLDTAESISGTVDSASRLAYTAFSSPIVKGMALLSGVGRGVRRLRRRT